MDAVVMAAGEGRRLRPVTERWPKPVLPIDGRPIVAVLLRELAAAGVTRATVVTGHLAEQVEALLGNGRAWGLEVRFVRQPRPDGSADVAVRALAAGAEPPFLVTAADTVYAGGDVGRFIRAFADAGADGAIAYRTGFEPSPARPGIGLADGRVTVVYDLTPQNRHTAAPLWLLGPELVPHLEALPGPPYELKDAYQRAIDDGRRVIGVEIGKTRDLTDPLDLVEENFPYLSRRT